VELGAQRIRPARRRYDIEHSAPTQVATLFSWRGVSAGMLHSCGVRRNGTVWCWGYNAEGQLGNGNLANSPLPGRIKGH